MKNNLLIVIFLLVFIASGFSQEKLEKDSKTISKSDVYKKNKALRIDKKTKELRKKLAYFQEHSPFKKSLLLSKTERKENGIPPNKYFESEWELTMSPTLGKPTPENLAVIRKGIIEERQRILSTGRVP